MWRFQEGITMGGVETKGTYESKGIPAMRRTSLPIVKSCKAKGKLLVTSITTQIKWNGHKEFPIHTFKNIILSLLN